MAGISDNSAGARPEFGRGLLGTLPRALFERPVVVTQPEPWALVHGEFDADSTRVQMASTAEVASLQSLAGSCGPGSAVFGIGGGMACDIAKFIAWMNDLPLVLVPTILSADAAFCKAVAIRESGLVRYVGAAVPDRLLIDFELINAAPKAFNRSGVGDILSIFTALWDWREANARLGERFDAAAAGEAQALLDLLFAGVRDLRDVTDDGIRLLVDLYLCEVRLCEAFGNSRPEEGSEHHLAYCLESLTRRPYLHGRLVALCALLVGRHQGQDVGPVREFLRDLELGLAFTDVGATREELRRALLHMKDFLAVERQLPPGVFHFGETLSEETADDLLNDSQDLPGV
ncbi:MAG: iron-containing alcohol dehydrogenase [Deltaproteobacteria bacterium]|nr:iron-containing alcohol dehydrogenase [Deltaproteobacteria bacterium]